MSIFDPRSISNDTLQREVDSGKIDAYGRSDAGGIYTYQNLSDGSTLIKDVEPADNYKQHQQTDFTIKDGYITSIRSHNDY